MFDIFKKSDENATQDVKTIRHRVLQFIKEQLQKWEGGEGNNIKGIQIFVAPAETEKGMYEGAIHYDDPDQLKDEIQRIADDYSIALPANWQLEIMFTEELPKEAVKASKLDLSLHVSTKKQPQLTKATTAYIRVVFGEAEQTEYTITATSGKVCIGREKKIQTEDGFFRENTIAFPGDKHESNKYVSRQHAHIEWNKEAGAFYLYADEGGLPPRNKIKVRPADGGLIKLQTTQIGHPLEEGDQILLGESALLQFTYLNDNNG
jgi:hypothetical protein